MTTMTDLLDRPGFAPRAPRRAACAIMVLRMSWD
jgi:hypothetical protein